MNRLRPQFVPSKARLLLLACLTLLVGCDQNSRDALGLSQPWPDEYRDSDSKTYTDPSIVEPSEIPERIKETEFSSVAAQVRQPVAQIADPDHEDLDATAWVQSSAEYHAIALQTYRMATERLAAAIADRTWSAIPAQAESLSANPREMPMAVILDLDETVIDNSGFQAELIKSHTEYTPDAWSKWTDKSMARAVPGAREFLRACRDAKVRVFFVTNREAAAEPSTRENLIKLGILAADDPDNILTKRENSDWGSDKSTRRDFLARDLRIVMLVGDDLNDFIWAGENPTPDARKAILEKYRSYVGERWFMLPNPDYGSWERSLYEFEDDLPRDQKIRRKLEKLWTSETGVLP